MKLSQLVKSPLNIRGEYIKETVEDLAESIKEHTLLRPLILRELENGTYEVLSGGRRKEALVLVYGQEHELEKADYKIFKGGDFEALSLGLVDQQHIMSFSSMELANGAAKLKELNPKISHKEIAKILWSNPTRIKRVLEMLKDEELIPDSVKNELTLSPSGEGGPCFTDAHWDRMKETALDLSDTSTVKDVCDFIMSHDVPPSKVAEVVSGVLKKQAKEAGMDSGEEKPKKEKPKDPNTIGEDLFEGYLDKESDGSWVVRGKKGVQPIDPHYYLNYADHPDFKVFVKAKFTVKNTKKED